MSNILVDTTSWNVEFVKSFKNVKAFIDAHSSCDWFTPAYLTEVYNVIKAL